MSMEFWVVAQTKPRQEKWAAENCARQGFATYLPMTRTLRPTGEYQIVCLFPRYLFVKTTSSWRSLLGTFGVTRPIMNGDAPAILPEKTLERLRAREGADGLIRLPNALEGRFKAEDPVRVNGGVMSGYTGVVEGMTSEGRVQVLLDFLGRRTRVLIGDDLLELAS